MFPGFNNKKHSTISSGDWDRDGVSNRKDCQPMNWKKQDKESLSSFIKRNRVQIDQAIKGINKNNVAIDDAERRMWILNDEGLYNWAKSEGVNV